VDFVACISRPHSGKTAAGTGTADQGGGTRGRPLPRPASSSARTAALAAILASVLAAGLPSPSRADQAAALRLADVLAEARERNPEIRAARERARAAAAVPPRVSAYDDPTLAYEAWNIPESLRLDRSDNNIFRVSQRIPFPGKRTLAGTVAEHEAEMARREIERTMHPFAEVATALVLQRDPVALLTRPEEWMPGSRCAPEFDRPQLRGGGGR